MAKKHRPAERTAAPAAPPALNEKTLNTVAIVALAALPLIFFFKYLFGGQMLSGTDSVMAGGIVNREFMADYIRQHGTVALWHPYILCGQPTVGGFFADLFYWPMLLLRLVLPVHVVWTWTFVLHFFAAGLGTYLFLREQKVATLAAALGGIGYMFSGSLMTLTYAGHDGRLIGSALLPLALFFLHRGMTRERLVHFLLCGLVVGMQLLSGHVQKVYYTGLILVAYFIFMLVRRLREERSAGLGLRLAFSFAAGMLFAGAFAAIQYLPVYGNMPYAARGADRGYAYATSWSMPIAETFDLLTPRFSGSLDNYWGKNYFKLHSEYLGILPLLFAVIAVFRCWRRPQVKFFFFSFVTALLLAWGGNTPFYRLAYLLPGISKFRGPAMIFFVAAFSLMVLAGFGLSYVLQGLKQGETGRGLRPALFAGLVPLGLFFVALVARDPLANLVGAGPKLAQFEANHPAMITGLLFAVLLWGIGFILARLRGSNRLAPPPFAAAVAAVMVLDMSVSLMLWDGERGYIRGLPPPKDYYAADDVVRKLEPDTSLYRVLPLGYARSDEGELMYWHIQSAGGQHPNPLRSFQEFIGAEDVGFQPNNFFDAQSQPRFNFLSVLNVKYIVVPRGQTRGPGGASYNVFTNEQVLPRAFVTPGYRVVENKDAVINVLSDSGFDPGRTCLLYDDPGITPSADSSVGTATVTKYDANRIDIRAELTAPGLLVLSENFHPDWQASVDGRPVATLRAFHTLRAVPLSAGAHEVRFRCESRYLRFGALISLASAILLVLVAAVTVLLDRRRMRPA